MNNVRKYPNRADKNLFLFLFLVAGASLTIAIVVATYLYMKDFGPNATIYAFFGTFFLLAIPFAILVSILTSPKVNGPRGRSRYQLELDGVMHRYKDFLLVKDKEGIENVLITPYGVIAISSRSYEGRIYGMENEESWRQSFAFKKQKIALPNPIKEQEVNIANLKKNYKLEIDIKSVVVLLTNNRGYINSKTLYAPSELLYLINKNDPVVLSKEKMEEIYNRLTK